MLKSPSHCSREI